MMKHKLHITDSPCTEHKDCTATTFASRKGVIGVRHLHQWLDAPGLWGRHPDLHVIGALNVGLLLDFDPETGTGNFDAAATVLTTSVAFAEVPPEDRLNDTYPVADDHRHPKDERGNHPKLRRPPAP